MSTKEQCAEQRRLNIEAGLRADGQPRSDSMLPPQRNDLEFMLSEIDFLRQYERERFAMDRAFPPPMSSQERAELRRLEIARSNTALGLKGDGKPRVYSTKPYSMKPNAVRARLTRKREAAPCETV